MHFFEHFSWRKPPLLKKENYAFIEENYFNFFEVHNIYFIIYKISLEENCYVPTTSFQENIQELCICCGRQFTHLDRNQGLKWLSDTKHLTTRDIEGVAFGQCPIVNLASSTEPKWNILDLIVKEVRHAFEDELLVSKALSKCENCNRISEYFVGRVGAETCSVSFSLLVRAAPYWR